MSEENKRLAREVFEKIWNDGDIDAADNILSGDYVANISDFVSPISGAEEYKQFVALFRALSPQLSFTVADQIAEGDKVATRWSVRIRDGAEHANLQDAENIEVCGMSIHRVAAGRLVESWDSWDSLKAFQSLGEDVFESLSPGM